MFDSQVLAAEDCPDDRLAGHWLARDAERVEASSSMLFLLRPREASKPRPEWLLSENAALLEVLLLGLVLSELMEVLLKGRIVSGLLLLRARNLNEFLSSPLMGGLGGSAAGVTTIGKP